MKRWSRHFDLSLYQGQIAEGVAEHVRTEIFAGRGEVKADKKYLETGNFYIEYMQFLDGRWRVSTSGVYGNEKEFYHLVAAGSDMSIWVSMTHMRRAVKLARKTKFRWAKSQKEDDVPTRGWLVNEPILRATAREPK